MKNRALKYSVGFAVAGVLITLLIAYVERDTINTYERNLPYISLGDNLKNRVTRAHLWFEELLAGDASVNYEKDVHKAFTTSRDILQGAYDGQETEVGRFEIHDDEDTKAILKEGIIILENLMASAQERIKHTPQAAAPVQTDSTGAIIATPPTVDNVGPALDEKFDREYESFQSKMDQLITHVNKSVKSDASYINTLAWISIPLVGFGVLGLCLLLYKLQRSSDALVADNTERLLQQNDEKAAVMTFIEAISSGNYGVELGMKEADNLGTTMISMRDKLRRNAEEDRRRNWSNTGIAQVGEILRTTNISTTELYDNIIRFVVKYTKSNQGGMFVLNEENEQEKYLELVACYAFERKKYLHKKVGIGEGLVGQSYLEGQKIYLLDVPEEYVSITSGLGGSNPNALLLMPLKVNEQIYGVLELATFGKFEDYEIGLVEKLAETIASTISTVRINESTRELLEKTQQQAEEMRAQEEEMRQNMEELEATQEEMRRKEKHIQNMLDGEKHRNEISQKNRRAQMELTKNNDVQSGNWNAAIEKITSTIANQIHVSRCGIWSFNNTRNKLTSDKLYTLSNRSFSTGTEWLAKDYPGFFEAITGEEVLAVKDVASHAATRELHTGYLRPNGVASVLNVPFFNEGRIAGVISCEQQGEAKEWTEEDIEFLKSCSDLVTVAYNTMKINTMVEEMQSTQQTLQAVIDNIPRAIFWKDKDLRFQGANRIFAQVAGVRSPRELVGLTDFDMPWKDHAEAYRKDDLAVIESRKSRLDQEERNVNSAGTESWVLTSKVVVTNQHGEVTGVLGMFEDITDRKHRETDIQAKLQELEALQKTLGARG
jgi:PAS domain S-box-containing protein